jgi:hypothetical protein
MAKLIGPLMSLEARGQVAKTLTYARLGMTSYAKAYKVPTNPNSQGQMVQRMAVKAITQAWGPWYAQVPVSLEFFWTPLANAWNLSLYHAYLKSNLERWKIFLLPTPSTEVGCGWIDEEPNLYLNVFGNSYSFEIQWDDPEIPLFCVQICGSKTPDFTPNKSNTIIVSTNIAGVFTGSPSYYLEWEAPDSDPMYFKYRWSTYSNVTSPWKDFDP